MRKLKRMDTCPDCGHTFEVNTDSVDRAWYVRGYKGDERYIYYLRCPKCYHRREVRLSQLPFSVIWFFIRKKR